MDLRQDGSPAEAFQHLPASTELLAKLLPNILIFEVSPIFPCHWHASQAPGSDSSGRPIPLNSASAKVLEAVVLRRILPLAESKLHGSQNAHRRAWGTGMHLLKLSDFTAGRSGAGNFACLVIFDVHGAFRAVPHHLSIKCLVKLGVEEYFVRYVATWLSRGMFKIRLQHPAGHHFSAHRTVMR